MQTINHFFNLHDGATSWVSEVVNSPDYGAIRRQMTRQMKGFAAPPAFDELVIRQLTDLLDIELSDVLIGAWRKRQEIIQYRDTQKFPPGEVHVVPLLEHTITSRHTPTIEPIINGVSLPKIKFDVVLRLKMKGAMLKIQAARIGELLSGECMGKGSIEYAGYAFIERNTAPVNLPGSIVFKTPIAI